MQVHWYAAWKHKFHQHYDAHRPFTQQITVCLLYCFSILWALCQDAIFLAFVVATKVGRCELDLWHIIHILRFISPNLLSNSVIIMEAIAIFQAWIWVLLHIGKCLIYSQIKHMVQLFEFWFECSLIIWNFRNIICVSSVFYIYTFLCSNPQSEFFNIHLNFTSACRHHEVYRELL